MKTKAKAKTENLLLENASDYSKTISQLIPKAKESDIYDGLVTGKIIIDCDENYPSNHLGLAKMIFDNSLTYIYDIDSEIYQKLTMHTALLKYNGISYLYFFFPMEIDLYDRQNQYKEYLLELNSPATSLDTACKQLIPKEFLKEQEIKKLAYHSGYVLQKIYKNKFPKPSLKVIEVGIIDTGINVIDTPSIVYENGTFYGTNIGFNVNTQDSYFSSYSQKMGIMRGSYQFRKANYKNIFIAK